MAWQTLGFGGFNLSNGNAPRAPGLAEMLQPVEGHLNRSIERDKMAQIQQDNSFANMGLISSGFIEGQRKAEEAAFLQKAGQAFASKDPMALQTLMEQNPGRFQQIQGIMGMRDEATAKDASRAAMQLRTAMESGDQNAVNALLQDPRIGDTFSRMGISPETIRHGVTSDPGGAVKVLDAVARFGDPQGYMEDLNKRETWRHQKEEEAISREGHDVQKRGQDLSYKSSMYGHSITARGQDMAYKAQMARLNHDKNVFDYSQRQIERANAVGELDVHELNSRIASTGMDPLTGKPATAARQKASRQWLEGNNNYNSSLMNAERDIERINALLNQTELEGVGRLAGWNPNITTSSQGVSNRNAIDELKSGAFVQNVQLLRGMGSLSNAEGQKLENLIARLDYTQPEATVKKQLREIRFQYSVLQRKARLEAESMGYQSSGYDAYVAERKRDKENLPSQPSAQPKPEVKPSSQGNIITSKSGLTFKVK